MWVETAEQREERRVTTSIRRTNALGRESPQAAEERRAAEQIRRTVALGEESNDQAEQRRTADSNRRRAHRRPGMTEQQQYLFEFDATKNGSLH